MESQEADVAVEILRERGAVLDPIAAVHVKEISEPPDFRAVNVAADDAVHTMFEAELDHRVLVIADVFDRCFRLELDIGGEGPVAEPKTAPDAVEPHVRIQNVVVQHRPHTVQQAVEGHDAVELMAVDDEVMPAIGAGVDGPFHQADRAELDSEELFEELVVVAGDKRDTGLFAALPKEFLQKHVVVIRPIPLATQLPSVNEITDDIDVFAFGLTEELKKFSHLGVLSSKVNVGNPNRTIIHLIASGIFRRT